MRSDKYPKSISEWGLPGDIDGALQWSNGKTYFFRQGQYWRFNDRRFSIDRSSNPFPRQTGPWWFGCPRSRPLMSNELSIEYSDSDNIDNNCLIIGDEDLEVITSYYIF